MKAIERALDWYRSRPTWGKMLLAIPLVLMLVGIVALMILSVGRFGGGGGSSDPLGTAVDLHADMIDAELDRTKDRDAELAEEAESFDRELGALEDEARDRAEALEKDHAAIDNAGSIADVDRALRDRDRG